MTETVEVVIVGAGPVGLSLAARMAMANIPAILLEAAPDLSGDPRASTFHPPTLEMLDEIGVTEQLIAEGVVVPQWDMRMHPSGEKARFDMSVLSEETRYPFRLQCEQARLNRMITERLSAHPNFDMRFNSKVIAVTQDADGVTVTYEDLEGRKTIRAAICCGTDGSHSVVRKQLGLTFLGSTYEELTVLATTPFKFEEHMEDLAWVSYCWGEKARFGLLKVPAHWRVGITPPPGMTVAEAIRPENVQQTLQNIIPRDEPYEIHGARGYSSHLRMASEYRVGRVVLAGDAAHLHSSAGGTGMNGGIHDAFALADSLEAIFKQGKGVDELDRYIGSRRPVTEREIMPNADNNRKQMSERDPDKRKDILAQMQELCADRVRLKEYLMHTSMIYGVRMGQQLAA